MAEESVNNTQQGVVEDDFLTANITVDERGFGPAYATVQWLNGDPKQKSVGGISYTGGFFISLEANVPEVELKAAGFEPFTLVTGEGEEVQGFAVRNLTVSPIRFRKCWQVDREGQLSQRFSNEEFDEASLLAKPRGVGHVLVGVKGITQPLVLAFKGLAVKDVLGMGNDRGIIPSYGTIILGAAKQVARQANRKQDYPLCSFTMTIGPDTEDGKKPKFTEVGSGENTSMVTKPTWIDAPTGAVDRPHLTKIFVGNETLGKYQDWHSEAQEWVDAFTTEKLAARRSRLSKGTSGGGASSSSSDNGVPGPNEVSL
jgi:hypothetical protein